MLRTATVVLALAMTGFVGCGGSDSPADKVAAVATGYYEASGASCSKEGIAIFVGQREDVYGCVIDDVPPENRPIVQVDKTSIRRCYIYTDGDAFDVTQKLQDLVDAQEASGTAVDEFPCLTY